MKYLSEVKGKSGTVARVVAYSVAKNSNTPLITFEYEAYRGILAELNTHGMLCKNAESSRAVPIKKRIEQIRTNPYVPIHWGSNQAGMVAGEEIDHAVYFNDLFWNLVKQGKSGDLAESISTICREDAWKYSAKIVADLMQAWDNAGYHKQIVNRIGEGFTTVKGVITATEWSNFWHLRRAPDADPAIKELADCMWKAKCEVEDKGLVEVLKPGEWHTPYYGDGYWKPSGNQGTFNGFEFFDIDDHRTPLTVALKTSAVACGQVSFRKLDTSEETVERVWKRLMEGETIHASVTQHQGTPMGKYVYDSPVSTWEELFSEKGVSHIDKEGEFWSAQFKHWIMFRKTLPNEVCNQYVPND